jgi:hypothetical protein
VNRKIRAFLVDRTDQRFVGRIALRRLTVRQVTQGHKAKRLGRNALSGDAHKRSHTPAFAKRNCGQIHGVIPFSKLHSLTSASRFDDDASHSLNTKALVDAR